MHILDGIQNIDHMPVGSGSFADVLKATYRGQQVALKRVRVFQSTSESQRSRSYRVSVLNVPTITCLIVQKGFVSRSSYLAATEPSVHLTAVWCRQCIVQPRSMPRPSLDGERRLLSSVK